MSTTFIWRWLWGPTRASVMMVPDADQVKTSIWPGVSISTYLHRWEETTGWMCGVAASCINAASEHLWNEDDEKNKSRRQVMSCSVRNPRTEMTTNQKWKISCVLSRKTRCLWMDCVSCAAPNIKRTKLSDVGGRIVQLGCHEVCGHLLL